MANYDKKIKMGAIGGQSTQKRPAFGLFLSAVRAARLWLPSDFWSLTSCPERDMKSARAFGNAQKIPSDGIK